MKIKFVLGLVGIPVMMASLIIPAAAQKPTIFNVSNVVVGTSRIETRWLFAEGKWSDAGDNVGPISTEIHCYKRLGFCDVASAMFSDGQAEIDESRGSFDILRWDNKEIIAVDSSPICVVNTLRADLIAKRITLSSTGKGVTKYPLCKGSNKVPTAFLLGEDDLVKAIYSKKSKK